MTTRELILDVAIRLLQDERIQLAMDLWELIGPELDKLPPSPEMIAELERRLAEFVANPSSGVPWEEVHRELLDELGPHDTKPSQKPGR